MNYKNLFKQMNIALAMILGFAACSEEDIVTKSISSATIDSLAAVGQVVYNMHLDCPPPDFEGKTTRANTDWADKSTIYLKFGSSSYGTAIYNKASGIWTVTASASLATTSSDLNCTAYYFEGVETATSSKVELKETTAIYQGTGTYNHPNSSDIYVSAKLAPCTWRLAFKGRSVTLLGTKSELKYYSLFNPQNHNMSQSQMGNVSLSAGQYVYGIFTYSGNTENSIVVQTDNTYERTLKGNELSVKNSGVLTAPTSSNYGTLGWKRNASYTFDVSPTNLSFDVSAASKTISVTGNDSWTATSTASWCNISKTSGSGSASISVSVTQNSSSLTRYATITLKGSNTGKSVNVSVEQSGNSFAINCKAEPDLFVPNPYGFATNWIVGSNVSKSYWTVFTKTYYDELDGNEQNIIAIILEDNSPSDLKDLVSTFDNDSWFVPNTDYVLCTISYDATGKRGELVAYPFRTSSTSLPKAEITSFKATSYNGDNIWDASIKLQNNAVGYYCYLDSRDTWYNNTNLTYLTWLVRYWITTGDISEEDKRTDTNPLYYRRTSNATIVTWAYNSAGIIGNSSIAKASTSANSRAIFNGQHKLRNGKPIPENIIFDPKQINMIRFVKVNK